MKKQYVKKIQITERGQRIPFEYNLPPDFAKLTGVVVETEEDTLSQRDTLSLVCGNDSVLNNYPDSEGVGVRLLRFDNNAQFPFKDSVLNTDISNAGNIRITGEWVNKTAPLVSFKPFYAKIYFLGE